MYLSDHEAVGSTATYPRGTMTLGRASNRAIYGGRVTAMGSSPNIASIGLQHADLLSYGGDPGSLAMLQHSHQQGVLLRQAVRGGGGGVELMELQAQLRDMQRGKRTPPPRAGPQREQAGLLPPTASKASGVLS
ncbi:hypothetical protein AOLI_G00252660 [Acnodon oligacanthus]